MKKEKGKDISELIGCFLTAFFLVALFWAGLKLHMDGGEVFTINDGWVVKEGEKIYVNVSLENMSDIFEGVKRKEAFTLTHPLNVQSHDPLILRVYSRLSAIRVMVDNRQVYSYGFANVAGDKMVGSGYHLILLPTRYYGKTLTIILVASEDDAIKSAPEILITPADVAVSVFARDRAFGIFAGLFLFMAGLLLLFLSVTAIYTDRRFYPIALIGMFACSAGIWCMSTIKALQLFSGDITLNSILEYLSMYFMPVPVLFLSRHFRQSASPRTRRFLAFMTIMSALFFISALFLQVSGIADVTRTVGIFHILLIPIGISLAFVGSSKWRRMKAPERMYQLGIILIAAMAILEVAVYYVINLIYELSTEINMIVTPLAMLTLSVVMAIGFLLEIYDMRLKDTERERLQRLAYRDQMTGLMNRGMCDRRMQELKESKEAFVMLDMDLNGLKTVNDKYGHLMGDRYIEEFSGIIKKAFGGDEKLYRVGGDEFLYIDTAVSEEELERKIELIRKLESMAGKENDIPFEIDASFGIAGSNDVPEGDPEEVYRLADKKMYDMKKSLKRARS